MPLLSTELLLKFGNLYVCWTWFLSEESSLRVLFLPIRILIIWGLQARKVFIVLYACNA